MSNIPVAIWRFSDNNFKRFYLKKKTLFVTFWLLFRNVHEIYNILKEKKEYPRVITNEIIGSERDVYLSV